MINLLITLLIFVIIAGLIYWVISLIPLPPPFGKIVQVVFAVICVIAVLYMLLPLLGATGSWGPPYHHGALR